MQLLECTSEAQICQSGQHREGTERDEGSTYTSLVVAAHDDQLELLDGDARDTTAREEAGC